MRRSSPSIAGSGHGKAFALGRLNQALIKAEEHQRVRELLAHQQGRAKLAPD